MDPSLAAPIATLTGAVATAIIMWASYNYPRGYHRRGAEKDEDAEVAARRRHEDDVTASRRAAEDEATAKLRGGHDVERVHVREDEDLAVKRQRLDAVPPDENTGWDTDPSSDPVDEDPEPEAEESAPDPAPRHAAPEPEPEPVAPKPPVKRAPRKTTSTKKAPPRKVAHPSKPKDPDGAEH